MTPVDSDEQDLTRKERREQARAQRKAVEQAELASATRRTRLRQLGIVVVIVVLAAVVILIASGGGSSKKAVTAGTPTATKMVNEVNTRIGGIPQRGDTLGNASAAVTLQYFGYLQSPDCEESTVAALTSVPET